MGLMGLFRKEKPQDVQPTAIDYVEWLLKHLLRTSRTELTLDTSRALPGSDQTASDDPPPCMPDTQAVINRLKILSGVNPVKQTKRVEGAFERPRTHHTVHVTTQFQDDAQRSVCVIRMHIRCKNA